MLFRDPDQQSRPIEAALRRAGVRYRIVGGQSFFDRLEIRDFLAYLKVLHNPHDDASLLRIANVPARGLSGATLERLVKASHERKTSVFATMRHTDVQAQFQERTRESLLGFLRFLEQARHRLEESVVGQPLAPWAEGVLTEVGYWDYVRRSERNTETADDPAAEPQGDDRDLGPAGGGPVAAGVGAVGGGAGGFGVRRVGATRTTTRSPGTK